MKINILVLWGLLFSSCYAFSVPLPKTEGRVTTAVPVLNIIALSLLASTPIDVVYLPPKRLPINRIPSWLRRSANNKITTTDAVLTIESVWPELSIFPLMRQKNIRLVEIDLANEIAPGGAGIRQRQNISEPDYFWLDSNNLLLMINIAARDLSRIWPNHNDQIRLNRAQALRQVQQFALQMDDLLLMANVHSLGLTEDKMMPLAQATFLPLVPVEEADLLLSSATNKKSESNDVDKKNWLVDPLIRPGEIRLEAWLNSIVASLKFAVEVNQ